MHIIRDLNRISDEFSKGSIVTLGNFDGIHLAHEALLKNLVTISKSKNLLSVVVTYFPNPALVLRKNSNFKNIVTQEEKEYLIKNCGVDFLVIIPFTQELANTNAEIFLKNILIEKLNAKEMIIGFNHCFGKNREGDFDFLLKHSKKYNFQVDKFEPVYFDEEKISSSLVRNLILQGDIEKANKLLGRGFDVQGKVKHGFHRGKQIGFPTANIEIPQEIILPPVGVYASQTEIKGDVYYSMTNIGTNPTFENNALSIETHILDYTGELHGKELKTIFVKRIRDEKKFSSIDSLVRQLHEDEKICRSLFGI
ncbi:MAG: bifunctional riboflavin kinase/FAD synthetase [Leptospiraceae bacterium]|nr:bifunctional riboflavin kinase/FAD synthetase [Leptospiraceae bacterium]MCK6382051.1 bifunctional riboflavin kinase/FAD synthetase [Leptospiraceae bacterium]